MLTTFIDTHCQRSPGASVPVKRFLRHFRAAYPQAARHWKRDRILAGLADAGFQLATDGRVTVILRLGIPFSQAELTEGRLNSPSEIIRIVNAVNKVNHANAECEESGRAIPSAHVGASADAV
jgi:hypothetical protein